MDNCLTNEAAFAKKQNTLVPIIKGEESCTPDHFWGPGVRQHYLIHYVISGKGMFYCGPNKYSLHKGQIFVIFPGTIIKYQADSKDPWHYSWITFYGDEVKEILSQIGISIHSPVLTVQNGDEMLALLRSMPSERSADLRSNLAFSSCLYQFMSLLVENQNVCEKSENVYLIAAKRYIKARYYKDITVDRVAAHVGISRKYLFAIFKKFLGISPKDYMIDYRMKRAAEFLKDKSISIGSIAYSVGYHDPLTFSKMFKQKMGLSPTQYRNSK